MEQREYTVGHPSSRQDPCPLYQPEARSHLQAQFFTMYEPGFYCGLESVIILSLLMSHSKRVAPIAPSTVDSTSANIGLVRFMLVFPSSLGFAVGGCLYLEFEASTVQALIVPNMVGSGRSPTGWKLSALP